MLGILIWILIFLVTVVLHELCHGLAAYALGDSTAKNAGRLTLNPLKHIDPLWTVLLPGLLFFATGGQFAIGMAKPVPVNFGALHHPKRDMIWVALAGPLANIVLAILFAMTWHVTQTPLFLYATYLNLGLALFNMIPIPPLDGSRVLAGLLPDALTLMMFRVERFGFIIILALYFTGVLFYLVIPGINFFCALFQIPKIGVHF